MYGYANYNLFINSFPKSKAGYLCAGDFASKEGFENLTLCSDLLIWLCCNPDEVEIKVSGCVQGPSAFAMTEGVFYCWLTLYP